MKNTETRWNKHSEKQKSQKEILREIEDFKQEIEDFRKDIKNKGDIDANVINYEI